MKEQRKNLAQNAGLEVVRKEIDSGQTGLVVSAIARTEVFRFGLSEEQKKTYQEFFHRVNAVEVEVSSAIAEKAADIRRKNQIKNAAGQVLMMKTPDAIHLATAIIYGVDEFQTWDGSAETPRDFPLLPLSGTAAVDGLKIVEPEAVPDPQPGLFTSSSLPSSTGPTQPA